MFHLEKHNRYEEERLDNIAGIISLAFRLLWNE
jgi:hypothetical protein